MNDWVKSLLQFLKVVAIIVAMVAIFIIWTAVPEDQLTEPEENNALEQSK